MDQEYPWERDRAMKLRFEERQKEFESKQAFLKHMIDILNKRYNEEK
jgi:uncharacterized coiled-coil protein SlyX